MFATFHCIAKRASTIRRIHPAGTALLARPGCPTLKLQASAFGPFDGLTRSDLGRIEPLPLAWSCDRLRALCNRWLTTLRMGENARGRGETRLQTTAGRLQ